MASHAARLCLRDWLCAVPCAFIVATFPAGAGTWSVAASKGESFHLVAEARPGTTDFHIERRLADGSPDTLFGQRGRVHFDLGVSSDPPAGLRVDERGRVLVVGTARLQGGAARPVVLRFLPNGVADSSWGTDGRSVVAPTNDSANALDVLPLPDGRVLVLGLMDSNGNEQATAWHLSAEGRLETASAGPSRFTLTGHDSSRGVSLTLVNPHQVMLGLRVLQGDDLLLEGHAYDPSDRNALPTLLSRQLWPPAWVDTPVWLPAEGGWNWGDPAQPNTPPVRAVRVSGAGSSPGLWSSVVATPTEYGEQSAEVGRVVASPLREKIADRKDDPFDEVVFWGVGALSAVAAAVACGSAIWLMRRGRRGRREE